MKKQKKIKSRRKYLDWRFPSLQKNRDNIALLVAYPEFQKEIKKIRLVLDLPASGNETNEANKNWTDKIVRKSDQILDDQKFIKQEVRIHEKLRAKEITPSQARKQGELLYNRLPFNYLSDSVKYIIKRFHLPGNYDNFVRSYIISNTTTIPTSSFVIGSFDPEKGWKNLGYIPVKIFTRLSEDDLKELKREIDNWIGEKLPKYQALRDVNKKIDVVNWHNDHTRYDEATGKEYTTNNKEIAENLLGSKNKNNKVYEIARSLKKLWVSRFGKE